MGVPRSAGMMTGCALSNEAFRSAAPKFQATPTDAPESCPLAMASLNSDSRWLRPTGVFASLFPARCFALSASWIAFFTLALKSLHASTASLQRLSSAPFFHFSLMCVPSKAIWALSAVPSASGWFIAYSSATERKSSPACCAIGMLSATVFFAS